MVVACWAALHGLVSLIPDGQAERVTPDLDALVETTAQLVMFGLAARVVAGSG